MSIEVFAEPAEEPVTLTEAKAHLRVTASDDDTYITALVKVARQMAETYLKRSICTQTLDYSLDSFPAEIDLPRPPARSITSITYTDEDGNSQSLSSAVYQTDLSGSVLHSIKTAVDQSWPSTQSGAYNAVVVRYVAGYAVPTDSPDLIPSPIKQAILLTVGELYENREETVIGVSVAPLPNTAERLLAPYRVRLI